jgi:DNA-binding response OmpR family regulator
MKTRIPTVLVAEDDSIIRQSLAIRLVQAGFQVVTAADGKDAEDILDHRHVDAAILDVKMPRRDGFGVCQHIRASGSKMPILMVTGAQEGLIRSHLGLLTGAVGGTHFMTKPYDAKALSLLLHDALASI